MKFRVFPWKALWLSFGTGTFTGAIPLQEVCPQTLWEMAFPALENGEWKKAFPVIPSLLIFRQLIYVGGLCYSRPMVRNRPQRR